MNSPMELGFDFDAPDPRRMVRADARDTEIAAAAAVQLTMNSTRQAVLDAVVELGGAATAEQLEQLPRFAHMAPSTVRKRVSELAQMGHLVADGTRLNSRALPMTMWRKVSPDGAARTPRAAEPSLVAAASPPQPRAPSGEFQIGERVRIRATRQLAEVYEVANRHEAPHAQRVRCGWSISREVGRDEWFDGDELERLP